MILYDKLLDFFVFSKCPQNIKSMGDILVAGQNTFMDFRIRLSSTEQSVPTIVAFLLDHERHR